MHSTAEIQSTFWDAVIIGTGMGGSTIGYALAQGGMKILFCEKGRWHRGQTGALLTGPPELHEDYARSAARDDLFRRSGRMPEVFEEIGADRSHRFVPLLGSGSGGSSAIYSMALERFFPADFEPARHHSRDSGSTLPERWPITYDELAPFYAQAEALYRVHGEPDPLRGNTAAHSLLPAPPLSPENREMRQFLSAKGLHPYRLPVACETVPGCKGCDGVLCPNPCKNDASRICLDPAITNFGAQLLEECEVLHIESSTASVTGVVCSQRGAIFTLRAKRIILAAGALHTPTLLLKSRSPEWPAGLANRSGMVGRNLMRHLVDFYLVRTRCRPNPAANLKELAWNDFYHDATAKLGTVQSFNHMPPGRMVIKLLSDSLAKNGAYARSQGLNLLGLIAAPCLDRFFTRRLAFVSILEDLPYADNAVLPSHENQPHQTSGVRFKYRISSYDANRLKLFRERISNALRPYRFTCIKEAENNESLSHSCGTCRFGDDPDTSVLNAVNKAHDLSNLMVVDASFFPSGSGINPSLTIAANALRVAKKLLSEN